MDWKKEYANKIVSVEEAVSHVQSGNRIVFTHACGEAQALTEELVRQADRLENVEIVHMVAMGKAPYCQPGMEKHFRHNALFVGGSTRKAVEEGRGIIRRASSMKYPSSLRTVHYLLTLLFYSSVNLMKMVSALMGFLLTIHSQRRKQLNWSLHRSIRICLYLWQWY